jgi:2-haloacid dehalogenase
MAATDIRALFFDVFGTVVDWRSGIAREAEIALAPKGHRLDWQAFADAWRNLYQPAMDEIRDGRQPYGRLDELHRRNLRQVLDQFAVTGLNEDEIDQLNRAWHKLDPWPDVVPGLTRLRRKFILATMSNGNIALMVNMARRAALPWDAILGAEVAGDYKPKPRVYLAGAEALYLKPAQCLMVAAHSGDLAAAAACGLPTAHIARPDEHGPGTGESGPSVKVDYAVKSMEELADRLGC